MAGLLHYNFFPTDFYYPRQQPADAGGGAAAVSIQTWTQKNKEVDKVVLVVGDDDLEWPKSLGFRVRHAHRQSNNNVEDQGQGKIIKYSPNPLASLGLLNLMPENLSASS